MRKIALYFSVLLIVLGSCREPYNAEIEPSDLKVLVVEGYLDTEGIPSIMSLSYTRNITQEDGFTPIYPSANVFLESEGGQQYPLTALGQGNFEFAYDIPENELYRLRILMDDGVSYTSDPIKPIITPEIIDVGYERNEQGVEVYLTTKGDENADDFLWTYEETYAFRPRIPTAYRYDPDLRTVVLANDENRTDLCYREELSSDLILETSSRFEDQFVFRQSIKQIPTGDERITVKYSILISQKALDQRASEFWEVMRKNTDDLGSIFSPLPSNIGGNFKNDQDPSAPVVGYLSLGTVRQQRLFIEVRDVIPWPKAPVDDYFGCLVEPDTVFIEDYESAFNSGFYTPAVPIFCDTCFDPIGFQKAEVRCTDCTLRGSNVAPDYWED
ncbi:DUF4249 domain-containing protein [Algoriphagus machipongonensis]|uniref:Lipoprotein n=1 Tax=Algoriphagus machipongonensis TaxID=388413 RepID=A3HXB7_9BACT|nr:DUF4249 domain-containing protein [Algoriphagus machipongonensis]EAZ81240.1 hypothetical protein ALPR1_19428 [Algoriphagus machipongonensis]